MTGGTTQLLPPPLHHPDRSSINSENDAKDDDDSLHMHVWIGIPLLLRIVLYESDPSGFIVFNFRTRVMFAGLVVCGVLATHYRYARRSVNTAGSKTNNRRQQAPLVILRRQEQQQNKQETSHTSTTTPTSMSSSTAGAAHPHRAAALAVSTHPGLLKNALFMFTVLTCAWPNRNARWLFLGVSAASGATTNEQQVCETDHATGEQVCTAATASTSSTTTTLSPPIICGVAPQYCTNPNQKHTRGLLYQHGGTAQAYKPNVPFSNTICDPNKYKHSLDRHNVAVWPYSRSSRLGPAPTLELTIRLMKCSVDDTNDTITTTTTDNYQKEECCCQPLLSSRNWLWGSKATIELWQTRPDGTYPSLRSGKDDDDCRARYQTTASDASGIQLATVAPGSTGILAGLGPNQWDFWPYGPPVLHLLVTPPKSSKTSPLLINVPLLMYPKTLEQRKFAWTDWRGSAWVKPKAAKQNTRHSPSYNITSWEPHVANHSVHITMDVFLREDQAFPETTPQALLCPSLVYGMPQSFFLEPISMCGSFLLDYFDL